MRELGRGDEVQVSYRAAFGESDAADKIAYFRSRDWTDDFVDVVRVGNRGGTLSDVISNILDMTEYGKSRDILFGLGGDDDLRGGGGDDYLYGGGDQDTLSGGAGSDVLDGEQGVDIVTYAAEEAGITITFDGTGSTPSLHVEGWHAGTDTLYSIEHIIGSARADYVQFRGRIPDGYRLTIDAGADVGDQVLNAQGHESGIQVSIDAAGNGTASNRDGSGGTITLLNFNT